MMRVILLFTTIFSNNPMLFLINIVLLFSNIKKYKLLVREKYHLFFNTVHKYLFFNYTMATKLLALVLFRSTLFSHEIPQTRRISQF